MQERKLDHEGWDLWVKVSQGDKKAQEMMTKYCRQDVDLLEKIFRPLRSLAKEIPNHNLFGIGDKKVCPKCGSTRVESRGYNYSATGRRKKFYCRDCQGWSSGNLAGEGLR